MSAPIRNQPERVALYRLHDVDGVLLYVGITSKPERRWLQHAADKAWWGEVADKSVRWYRDRKAAAEAERAAMRAEKPRHNQSGNPHARHELPPSRAIFYDVVDHWRATFC